MPFECRSGDLRPVQDAAPCRPRDHGCSGRAHRRRSGARPDSRVSGSRAPRRRSGRLIVESAWTCSIFVITVGMAAVDPIAPRDRDGHVREAQRCQPSPSPRSDTVSGWSGEVLRTSHGHGPPFRDRRSLRDRWLVLCSRTLGPAGMTAAGPWRVRVTVVTIVDTVVGLTGGFLPPPPPAPRRGLTAQRGSGEQAKLPAY